MNSLIKKKLYLALLFVFLLVLPAGCGKKSDSELQKPVSQVVQENALISENQTPSKPGGAQTIQEEALPEQATVSQQQAPPDQEHSIAVQDQEQSQENDQEQSQLLEQSQENEKEQSIPEDGTYTSKEDVALYIHTYGKLPGNFITKKQAKKLGWSGGSLEEYAPGKCIGGDYFGNYEGILPEDKEYHECDIETLGKKKRGAKRIIYSDDGYIYYTEDHYESFELLYEPD